LCQDPGLCHVADPCQDPHPYGTLRIGSSFTTCTYRGTSAEDKGGFSRESTRQGLGGHIPYRPTPPWDYRCPFEMRRQVLTNHNLSATSPHPQLAAKCECCRGVIVPLFDVQNGTSMRRPFSQDPISIRIVHDQERLQYNGRQVGQRLHEKILRTCARERVLAADHCDVSCRFPPHKPYRKDAGLRTGVLTFFRAFLLHN
ncbi:unnamed protein product, partial [Ectocarpus sp. 4 AP-2014]